LQRATAIHPNPWPERRRRAEELRGRYPFAGEVLRLYLALLPVHEEAWREAPAASELVNYALERVLPPVLRVTVAAGPDRLAGAALARFPAADLEDLLGRWLRGAEQSPVDRYLARASLDPLLEALGPEAAAVCTGPCDQHHCPSCGGPPQLSWYAASGESLVTGRRQLLCARCGTSWPYGRLGCAACGESAGGRLPVFGEARPGQGDLVVRGLAADDGSLMFPHLRVQACDSCHRYLICVDLGRDARALPVVDELAALPLDLYAKERGYQKVVPNLMGF
jgi:FdhE protein